VAKRNIELTVKQQYTLTVYDEPGSHLVEIHQGGLYIGWVGIVGASQNVSNELEAAARTYLLEVRPELKENKELGKSGPARPLDSPHS
jgi:hypothetical protein